jgi:hypothetical protein
LNVITCTLRAEAVGFPPAAMASIHGTSGGVATPAPEATPAAAAHADATDASAAGLATPVAGGAGAIPVVYPSLLGLGAAPAPAYRAIAAIDFGTHGTSE